MTMSMILIGSLLTFGALQDDGKKELEKVQGKWVATVYEVNGRSLPPEVVKTIKFTFTDDKYVQEIMGMEAERGTQKLDPSKKPKEMDISITEGDGKGMLQLAIYELDGDTIKICANGAGDKSRPKEFSAKGGAINIVIKREKSDKDK